MLTINDEEKQCYIEGEPIQLTKSEYNLLKYLHSNQNKIHSREDLINKIWKEKVSDKAVNTTISRLRRKLGDDGKNIVSRIGFGYGYIENK